MSKKNESDKDKKFNNLNDSVRLKKDKGLKEKYANIPTDGYLTLEPVKSKGDDLHVSKLQDLFNKGIDGNKTPTPTKTLSSEKTIDVFKKAMDAKPDQYPDPSPENKKQDIQDKVVNSFIALADKLDGKKVFKDLHKGINKTAHGYQKMSAEEKVVAVNKLLHIAKEIQDDKKIKGQDNLKKKIFAMAEATENWKQNPQDEKAQKAFEVAATELSKVKIKKTKLQKLKDAAKRITNFRKDSSKNKSPDDNNQEKGRKQKETKNKDQEYSRNLRR